MTSDQPSMAATAELTLPASTWVVTAMSDGRVHLQVHQDDPAVPPLLNLIWNADAAEEIGNALVTQAVHARSRARGEDG